MDNRSRSIAGTLGQLTVFRLGFLSDVGGKPGAGRLVQVENGYGARTTITYRSAKEDATMLHQVPFPEIVVSEVQTTGMQGLGGDFCRQYGMLMVAPSCCSILRWTRFTFPGYQRLIRVGVSLRRRRKVLQPSPMPTSRLHQLTPTAYSIPDTGHYRPSTVAQRYSTYLRAGHLSDVTVLSGSLGADPWALLSADVTSDSAAHCRYALRMGESVCWRWVQILPQPEPCPEMVLPYDLGGSILYALFNDTSQRCLQRAKASRTRSVLSRGEASRGLAPPSTANIVTRSRGAQTSMSSDAFLSVALFE